jgi:hypothetical protein
VVVVPIPIEVAFIKLSPTVILEVASKLVAVTTPVTF